ncbi:MAG: hypothetical protein CM1200mP18_12290 [Gammaproteobacteria bacterium]|nr:MAG: hypothetical protein CM1200mP18_12290 [Gammaproteobacteria bacterium]
MHIDGFDGPLELVAELTIDEDSVTVDFAGTSDMTLHPGLMCRWLTPRPIPVSVSPV